jgi:HK97 family phage portal protein
LIIRARGAGEVELRTGWPDYTRPPRFIGQPSIAGERVTPERAFGLPAFGNAVRLIAGIIASSCLEVFQGEGADKVKMDDSWQAQLFEQPALDWSEFAWLWDVAASLEATENAVLQKMKARGRVTELIPVDMNYVSIFKDPQTREKIIQILTPEGPENYTSADMLHIRGQTPTGSGIAGVSRIMQHRDPLGAQLAAQHFEGAFYRNNARPDVALLFPTGVTQKQAAEWRDAWQTEYGGPENAGKAVPLGGGADIKPIPVSMQDAQFLQYKAWTVEEAGRILDIHPLVLNHAGDRLQGDALRAAMEFFLHVQMPPRMKRISSGLNADTDLFKRSTVSLYSELSIDELAFVDPKTRAEVEHQQIQDGTKLVDEVRAARGEPPLPPVPSDPHQQPGKVPQITPVGGAPNQQKPATSEPSLDDPVGAAR